jgi:hypothetical protein
VCAGEDVLGPRCTPGFIIRSVGVVDGIVKPQRELNLTRMRAQTAHSTEVCEALLEMMKRVVGPVRLAVVIEQSL